MTGVTASKAQITELAQAFLLGDEGAFDGLMRETHRLVRKLAAPLVPATAVDDVVQETYILVYKKIHHLKRPEAFTSWLGRIALNECYKWRRKADSTEELDEAQAVSHLDERRLQVREALTKLKERDRNILVLREFLGFSYEEIADAVNIPEGTVRSRLHYARKKLREFLS